MGNCDEAGWIDNAASKIRSLKEVPLEVNALAAILSGQPNQRQQEQQQLKSFLGRRQKKLTDSHLVGNRYQLTWFEATTNIFGL